MKKSLIVFIVAVILGLSACSDLNDIAQEQNEAIKYESYEVITSDTIEHFKEIDELTLNDVINIANQRRYDINLPDINRVAELFRDSTSFIVREDLFFSGETDFLISREDAIYDTNIFFDMLRYYYAAYLYFGGDEVFLPLQEKIIETLSEKDEWITRDFRNVIYNHISDVINDNHFVFDGGLVGTASLFLYAETPFNKTDGGFINRDTGLYVKEIVGYDINDVFRLTVNECGEFFYIPIIYKAEGNIRNYDITIIYCDDSKEVLQLSRHIPRSLFTNKVSLTYERGFPIVTLQKMGDPNSPYWNMQGVEAMERARYFLSSASYLYDSDVIIVDIRSNRGGNSFLTRIWLYLLTTEIIPYNHIHFMLQVEYAEPSEIPPEIQEFQRHLIYMRNSPYVEITDSLIEMSVLNAFPNRINFDLEHRIITSDRLIILIVDRFTASAGELFADLILSMENTLIVGQNTSGTLLTADSVFSPFFLPNSNTEFNMSRGMSVFDEDRFMEGRGFAPDVWVIGDALTAVLAMLDKYR